MDPITATALATTALKVGSTIFGNKSKKKAAEQQYNYQLNLQHDAQAWQENMSNTAHQREVADLQKAGLNPVLSANNGASMGTAGAGEAQMAQPEAPNVMEALNTAKDIELANEQKKNLEANTIKQRKESAKTESEKRLIDIQADLEPKVKQAKIRLDNAHSAQAKQEIEESISREFINDLRQQLLTIEMDNKNLDWKIRKKLMGDEIELYKTELENKLIEAGYDQTTVGLIIKSIGKSVNALSPLTPYTGTPDARTPVYIHNHNNYNY